jgi:hypothetical protein
VDTVAPVPGPKQKVLSASQRRKLMSAQGAIREAEIRWAHLVREELGYSAVAREMGFTSEAVRKRVLKILGD